MVASARQARMRDNDMDKLRYEGFRGVTRVFLGGFTPSLGGSGGMLPQENFDI